MHRLAARERIAAKTKPEPALVSDAEHATFGKKLARLFGRGAS
jgi:hypothetical protein